MRSRAVLAVVVAIAAVVVAAPVFAFGQSLPDAGRAQPTPEATSGGTNTTIAIHPRPNGDARFRVSATFVLDGANETAGFRALAREFEAGTTGFTVSTFRRAANESSDVTGRSMNVTNVTRNATIMGENSSGADTGRLVLGFTWTNFARTSGEHLFVGDAFNTTHETWLPTLTANQTLLIESPRGYAIVRSPVGISNGTARWEGPARFETGSPSVAFERRGAGSQGQEDDDGGLGSLASAPLYVIGAGAVVLGVGALGAYALARRGGATTEDRAPRESATGPPEKPLDDADEATSKMSDETESGPAEAELLSDEERVERLLKRNGGRMKQASIVAETGWSNAKVSQLLSAMAEAGQVEKLRIGRENLISLPGEREE